MKVVSVAPENLTVSAELARTTNSKQFEERLEASIREIGLAEPLKVASLGDGTYLVVDGVMRLRAINAIREDLPDSFPTVPAYEVDFARRFEVRFQTDIYQDLLPSQLAALVEHLHEREQVSKGDIARFIGVSPATLRNYTGVWRLMERGGWFLAVVELMDVGVIPSSNPFAWLRLTEEGIAHVLAEHFAREMTLEVWVAATIQQARAGDATPFPIKFVEEVTGALYSRFYREGNEVRALKQQLGKRRAIGQQPQLLQDTSEAMRNLASISRRSREPVLKVAASALRTYLQ